MPRLLLYCHKRQLESMYRWEVGKYGLSCFSFFLHSCCPQYVQPRRAEIQCALLLRKRIMSIPPPPALPSHRRGLPKCRYRQHTNTSTTNNNTGYRIQIVRLHLHLNHPPPILLHTRCSPPSTPFSSLSLTLFFYYLFDQLILWHGSHSRPVHVPLFLPQVAVMEMITPTLGASVLGDTSSPHIP